LQPLDCQRRFVPLVRALNLINRVAPVLADGQLAGVSVDLPHQFVPFCFQCRLETHHLSLCHFPAPLLSWGGRTAWDMAFQLPNGNATGV
jgi:hypothetical protein